MKYIITESILERMIFHYLDLRLKGLEKRNTKYHFGYIVYAFPDEKYGILGYENNGTLYICYKLIYEISNGFGLNQSDSESIIGRWVSDRFQLEVKNTKDTV